MFISERRKVISLPYKPRSFWASELHPALEKHRFSVIVAHRRFGKTVGTINHLIKRAVLNKERAPRYAYVAPFRNQAKMIAWEYLKYYSAPLRPKVNETSLFVEFMSRHEASDGAKVFVVGADHPDALRGTYWDGVVIDEYAQIKSNLWDEVVRPSLADRAGWAVFIGTPKGQNQFYEVYQHAERSKDWFTCLFTAEDTGIIPAAELADMKSQMTEMAVRQELYCDFTASAYNVLVPIDVVTAAVRRDYTRDDVAGSVKVIGVDVARFGDDRSVVFKRQGQVALEPKVYSGLNNMDLADRVLLEIDRFKPNAVFVDAGRGEGVIDRLRQLGRNVTEINFGGKALKDSVYYNRRSEMWDKMRDWLEKGGAIPDLPELKAELTAPEFEIDHLGRIRLESKKKLKEKTGRSPDLADALALTFAMPVVPKHLAGHGSNRRLMCSTDYDVFKNA
ncbi:terminase family protein [Selenomonadales bacterium OttesenSCG-928-I06]|nr:terminase family protein [Selenomonadales bacterium OttesenSCG-928-I06]